MEEKKRKLFKKFRKSVSFSTEEIKRSRLQLMELLDKYEKNKKNHKKNE